MKQMPWGKLRSNLHRTIEVGRLSDKAFRLLFCVICLAAGTGSAADTGSPPDDVLWDAGVDHAALDEAIARGVLMITGTGTVALTELVAVHERSVYGSESTNPSTLRSQKHRAMKAADKAALQAMPQLPGLLVEVTPGVSPPAPPQSPPPSRVKTPATETTPTVPQQGETTAQPPVTTHSTGIQSAGITTTTETVQQATEGEALIFPPSILPAERRSVLRLLSGLPSDRQQTILDELARQERKGAHIRSRLGWIRTCADKDRVGEFHPEMAYEEAEDRRLASLTAERVRVEEAQRAIEKSVPVDWAAREAEISKNKDPIMRKFLLNHLQNMRNFFAGQQEMGMAA